MPAETIAHFRFVRKLGEGGMGQVWLADDLRLSRRVALKLLPELTVGDDRTKRRLLQEARAAAGLMHPNVCVIYEAGESQDGIPYISMEAVEGQTLRDRIARGRPAIAEATSIGAQMAEALAAAHAKGIIHRDIKPGNVMIAAGDQVKVLDFGLAKVTSDSAQLTEETAVRSATGAVVGTTPYMSPEQGLGRQLDHRSDVFSLGIVLYEMVTGRRPFEGQTTSELIYHIIEKEPEPVRRLNPSAPPELETIIHKCLQKDPANRYQSAADIATDLRAIGRPAAAGPKRKWGVVAAAAALLIAAGGFYAVSRSRPTPPAEGEVAIRSIAVLPFVNMSAERENEYFSDGLTEELLNVLAQVKGLRVAARTSSFQFKGVSHDVGEIGRKLNVQTVLEGSVRKDGNNLRITAQLINVGDGYHIWSKTYDRELEDVFAIQTDLATSIVANLLPRFASSPVSTVGPTGNIEAYDLYLQGRHQFWQGASEENLRRAADFFQRAVEADQQFALAYAGLSDAYMLLGSSGYVRPAEVFPRSKAAAERALALNDRLAEGYVALASINWLYEWDWKAADLNYRRSFSVNPLLHTRCICYVWYLASVGNLDLAVVEAERALELDPLARLPRVIAAWIYSLAGRDAEAKTQLAEIFALNPNDVAGRRITAWMHWRTGHREQAIAELEKVRADFDKKGGFAATAPHIVLADLASMYARSGRRAEAAEILQALRRRSERQYIPPENIGAVYAALGEMDEAMRWLDRAWENRSNLGQFNILPFAQPLHDEPRYQALLAKIGLPRRAA
ncbi:MAG TPA: protein kinase [Gemmatimonadaceae bacterium]|nr:protein kinase [Gemmatimonadaceae bacterium]